MRKYITNDKYRQFSLGKVRNSEKVVKLKFVSAEVAKNGYKIEKS